VSPLRLAEMNWRLDNPPTLDVSISRHMGLYAVSRLAARHGIRVRLRPGAPQGLSALVWLPGALANRDPGPSARGHSRSLGAERLLGTERLLGAESTGPAAGTRTAAPARHGPGRHRSGLVSPPDDQPLLPGREEAARPTPAWFAAKRPSSGSTTSPVELAAGWQSATHGRAPAGGTVVPEPAARAGQTGQTASGLPRRVPRTSAQPGGDTPGAGMPAAAAATAVPVLSAPFGGTPPRGVPHQEAPHQERVPSRRRSPEAARSRLTGFQLGSRDAVEAGHTASSAPPAGEENSR